MSNWLALINTAPADVESLALELDGASIDLDDFAQKLDNSGLSIDDMKSKLSKVGISSETFDKALKASQGNAADFADYLWQAANDGTTLDDVVDALGGDLGNLQGIMDNTAGTTDVMADAMMSGFGGSLEKLKSSLDVLMVDMGRLISEHLTPIITKIQEWVDAFNAMDDSEKEQVIRIAAIAAAIGPLLVTGGKLLTGVGKILQFAPQISTALSGVSSVFGGLSTSLAGLLAPIAAIVAVIGVLVAAFMNLWNNNEAFRTNMIATWESIKASFAGFIAQVQERLPAIQAAFTSFIEFVRPLWEAFCQILAPMFESAFSMVATVLQTIFDVIISVIDMMLGIFTADKELFMTGLTEFLTAIVTFLTTMLNLIWTTILNVVNVILSFFGTSLATLKTNITTAFTNIVTSVREKITEFRDLIFEKIGEVVDYIAELPGKFLQWGTDMINNLIAGIRSGIDAVGEAVSAVADKISSFLHFSEPDAGPLANFNSWMPDMMKQMADQIEAGRLQVQLAASHVAADIAAPMESAQNFTLNNSFTFNGGYTEAEGREIARRINRELGALYI
jgi:phage-related protein